ncbi:MAG: hypothetical protein H7A48_13140 [Akkermansiaceae bacterium]|nr:hypothetical protein [Akkermansiaceae bacterium]
MTQTQRLIQGSLAAVVFPLSAASAQTVFVSRMWHNHQPLYWPEWNTNGAETSRVEYAWDSIVLKPGRSYSGSTAQHPENNLTDIFGLDDRRNAYQFRPQDSLAACPQSAGFCLSYSGSLIDNVRQLGALGQLGYGGNWWDGNRSARNWTTPSGSRRLDLVGFTYHHSLAPLLPKEVFRKELRIFKQAWWKAWGGNSDLSDHSKGFFPTEMAFSQQMVDVLVDEGYDWSIVASHHLSRTCPTYFNQFNLSAGSYGIFSSPPNKADLLGPSPSSGWWYSEPNPGNAAWNVAPYAYQLHKARYVNPETGSAKEMIVVPSDDVLSYRYGYANEGVGKINDHIAPYATDPSRPCLVMPATDGDNAWGGGFSSWMEATPQFFNSGYSPTAVQDFVNSYGGAAQTVHVEDGAWIFPESDYGSPYFLKWLEPPVTSNTATRYPGTIADMETPGFALKFWAWAPVITGANWVQTAEQILRDEGGSVDSWKIQAPYDWNGTWNAPNDVELAWHIYLGGLDSGFNYYGGLGNDDEVKAALATTRAIQKLQPWMTPGRMANDRTPPSVLKPQRFPYNPGGYTFGWFNSIPGGDNRYLKKMPSDFYVWTHAYDVSGVTTVNLKVRVDNDGTNTMANDQNETYAGGGDVGSWITIPMTKRVLPNDQASLNAAANNGQINYFITPPELADYYFAKITNTEVNGFRNKLLDYYIEAVDSRGNVEKSEIQHVFVEDDGDTPPQPEEVVSFSPEEPTNCEPVTISYNPTGRALASAPQVYIHIGRNGWQDVTTPRPAMTLEGDKWTYTYNPLPGSSVVDFVFTNAADGTASIWDNNGGADWHISLVPCEGPPLDPPTGLVATATSPTTISLDWDDTAGATSYTVFRGAVQLGIVTESDSTDTGLMPETSYSYTVVANNNAGSSDASDSASATTPPESVTPPPTPFVLDGIVDSPGYLVSDNGMVIHAALRGDLLYVSTWAPGEFGNDHFIVVSDEVADPASSPSPWAKSGFLASAAGSPFLAAESSNAFAGWFNTNGAVTEVARGSDGQQLEGTIDIVEAFGTRPATLYLAALAYQTADAGILGAQAPAMVTDNGDVDADEWLAIPLEALRDEDANGIFDRVEPGVGFVIRAFEKGSGDFTITWNSFPGRSYKLQSSASLTEESWGDVEGGESTAGPSELEMSRTVSSSADSMFFRVVLLP